MEKKLKIKPQNERVLVAPIMVSSVTKSGLAVSTDSEVETTFAEVVAVSEDLKDKHKVGDVVYHAARAGIKISLSGQKYKILTNMEILAKLEIDKADRDDAIRENLV